MYKNKIVRKYVVWSKRQDAAVVETLKRSVIFDVRYLDRPFFFFSDRNRKTFSDTVVQKPCVVIGDLLSPWHFKIKNTADKLRGRRPAFTRPCTRILRDGRFKHFWPFFTGHSRHVRTYVFVQNRFHTAVRKNHWLTVGCRSPHGSPCRFIYR